MTALKVLTPKLTASPLIVYSMIIFFVCLGDAIMSYVSPVYIESHVHSAFLMGIVLSASSTVGVFFDFFISDKQWNRGYRFFMRSTIVVALLFPIVFLVLPAQIPTFLIGMALWGAYYEYRGFSNFNFIHHFLSKDKHAMGWGVVLGFMSFAYLIGAAISTSLIDEGYKFAFIGALVPFVLALLTYNVFTKMHGAHMSARVHVKEVKKGLGVEFKILRTLWKRAWPIFTFSFLIMLIDACFWTVGTLLSERLKDTDPLGSLFLVAFMFPPIFTGMFAASMHSEFGKKRTAYINGLLSAIFLVAIGTTHNVPLLIGFVVLMSVFLNIAHVLHSAAIEDYVARLGDFGNDLVTIEQLSGSTAYIVGPILLGFLAETYGYQETFAFTGVLMGFVAFFCLFYVPRKLKMPQAELRQDVLTESSL